MKGAIGWKLIALALDRDPWKLYLMFLSRKTDSQLCQIYTKIQQMSNQSENNDIPENANCNLGLLQF